MLTTSPQDEPQGVLSLEFQYQRGQIRVASREVGNAGHGTLRRYEDARVSLTDVDRYAARIRDLLGRANRRGKVGPEILGGLEKAGQLLYEELFPVRTKEGLNRTAVEHLVLGLDDRLVHIPWELAHDGEEFLCRRFCVGRVVSTRQEFATGRRVVGRPLSMLLLADPQGNLPAAYQEGIELRDLLDRFGERIAVTLKSSHIPKDYVRGNVRDYDILHYAGHAEYSAEQPGEASFLLADGRLSARELRELAGRRPFPALVFSNACDSGHTGEWRAADGYEHVHGLANAFLLAGVRHYLGTFWEVPDDPSLHFARGFYEQLVTGATVGAAVCSARRAVVDEYGEDTIFWASYMLYGDPTVRYAQAAESGVREMHPSPRGPDAIEVGALRGTAGRTRLRLPTFGARHLALAAVVVVAVFASVLLIRETPGPGNRPPSPATAVIDPVREVRRARASDARIVRLAERYRAGDLPTAPTRDEWVSVPLTVVFLDVRANGATQSERDALVDAWVRQLQATARVRVVERDLLDDLLRELDLGSSELSSPDAALRLGRILSANLLLTGSVAREGEEWLVSLRAIETETTEVVATVSLLRSGSAWNVLAEEVGAVLLAEIRRCFPLQGRVLLATPGQVEVNVGSALGLRPGRRFVLLGEAGEPAGEVRVTEVEEDRSRGEVVEASVPPQVGQRVREIQDPDGT